MKDWLDALLAASGNSNNNSAKPAEAEPQVVEAAVEAAPTTAELDPSKVKVNDFDLISVIGRGSYGKVLKVKHRSSNKVYAMKVLNKKVILDKNELEHTKNERSILVKLRSPFLVQLHFAFQTADRLYFVMDYINGGELFHHLQKDKKFNDERVKFYAAEIVLGLEYLHKEGIIYRDLKPENLLLTNDGHICMTDFGISKEGLACKESRTSTFCGTPEYLAPEVLRGVKYGKEIDWWSFGTLIYEMMTGLPPFYCEDVQLMYDKIMTEKLNPKKIDEVAINLLQQLLERDPVKRLSDPEKVKSHPYFVNIDWDKLAKKEVPPPYIPPVAGDLEADSMIDPDFLNQPINTPTQTGALAEAPMPTNPNLEGFTYVSEGALAAHNRN